jgi:hypothetical protein
MEKDDAVSAFSLSRISPSLRHVTAVACLWEAVAIWRHGWTFSRLAQRFPWLAPTLIAAITLHLIFLEETAEATEAQP